MNTTTTTTTAATKRSSTLYMVELAMMIAIILLMSFTPLGYLRTPGLSITLLTIPVAVGAMWCCMRTCFRCNQLLYGCHRKFSFRCRTF